MCKKIQVDRQKCQFDTVFYKRKSIIHFAETSNILKSSFALLFLLKVSKYTFRDS